MIRTAGQRLLLQLHAADESVAPQATVRTASGQEARTDAFGRLLLEKLSVGRQLLQVEAPGFISSFLSVDVDKGVSAGMKVELIPLGEPVSFDASEGVTVSTGDTQLSLAPDSLFDAQGQVVRGMVDVFVTALNLDAGELLAAPGLSEGVIRGLSGPVDLESFGMVAVSFQQEGRVIPFARSVGVRGNCPGSIRVGSLAHPGSAERSAQATRELPRLPVWRLDPDSGRWVPTGDWGHLEESTTQPDTYEWVVTVDNPSPVIHVALPYWWRSELSSRDNPLQPTDPPWVETAWLAVQVEEHAGTPVAGREVVAQGVDYMGLSRAVTDAHGRALLPVMRNQRLLLNAGEGAVPLMAPSSAGTRDGQGTGPEPVTLQVAPLVCVPGEMRACPYGGPRGMLGVGACQAARQVCNAAGTDWSAECRGEVLPQEERCDTPVDDDCNGERNETCASVCEEGVTRSCYEGPAGTESVGLCQAGTQQCVAEGTLWSACQGQVLPQQESCSQPEDRDCNGTVCVCWPGDTEPCSYTGPIGTEGVGRCHAGVRACNAAGTAWEACTGEVTPLPEEDCLTAEDDDCDGQANEPSVCICTPNSSRSCYTGPAGTQGIGICQAGTQTCNAAGTAWGACTGEVTPLPEICAIAAGDDYDCDGLANEAPPCAWAATNLMGWPRYRHAAALLSSNQVLVSGGFDTGGAAQATAEVYDAATGTWSPVGSMQYARTIHTATLLNHGRVLVAGGMNAGNSLATAEEYDPTTQTWSTVDTMASARRDHTATLLSDGKVLIAGGYDTSANSTLDIAEVYDPVTRTWSAAGTMRSARAGHTATLLRDGRVLVSGGAITSTLASAEVYDPGTRTWSFVGSMSEARQLHTATLLKNGQVLVAGGERGPTFLATAEVYDPAAQTWFTVGAMRTARTSHPAVLLRSGQVLVTGGYGAGSGVDVYNPVAQTWRPGINDMSSSRAQHTAVLLSSGQVLVSSGYGGGASGSAEVCPP